MPPPIKLQNCSYKNELHAIIKKKQQKHQLMQFEWDDKKNSTNKSKHGISFELAVFVFQDPFHISIPDIRHNYHEERWLCLGLVKDIVLYVAFKAITEEGHHEQEIIRIISARRATPNETKRYHLYRQHGKRT